jgi:hypothetical protein
VIDLVVNYPVAVAVFFTALLGIIVFNAIKARRNRK